MKKKMQVKIEERPLRASDKLGKKMKKMKKKNTMNMDGILANACLCRGLPLFSPSAGSVEKKKDGKKKKKKKVSCEVSLSQGRDG